MELLFRWIARRIAIPVLRVARNSFTQKLVRLLRSSFSGSRLPVGVYPSTRLWAESVGAPFKEILPQANIQRALPKTIHEKLHWNFRQSATTQVPSVFFAVVAGGRILGAAGHVVTPDDKLLGDVCREWFFEPEQNSFLFKIKFSPPLEVKGKAAALAVASGGTYYHWLTDMLPRLAILERAGQTIHTIDHFVVNDSRAPFVRESLDLLGIPPEKCIGVNSKTHLHCETLLLPSHAGVPGKTPGWVVDFLRQKFLPKARPPERRLRVYISRQRSKYRKFGNAEEVRALLLARGFAEFFLEELPFPKQVELFASADVVVSAHGAGLTNIAFCNPGAKVLEIFSPNYVNECFWNIATFLELEYAYLLGEGRRPPEFKDPHKVEEDIQVNLAELDQSLTLLGV